MQKRFNVQDAIRFFNNLNMASKLFGGFGCVLFLFLIVMIIYHGTLKSTTRNFKNLMGINVTIANRASDAKNLMKDCRVAEKNFLSTLDKKYLENIDKNIESLTQNAKEIVTLAEKTNNKTSAEAAKKVSEYVAQYASSFKALVAANEKRGLDNNSGIRGEFAKITKRTMDEMTNLDVEDLYVHYLKIFKNMDDLAFNRNPGALETFKKAVDSFDSVMEHSEANADMVKSNMKEPITNLKKLADTYVSGGDRKETYKSLLTTLGDIDSLLRISYVPNFKSMILKIRSSEKDYLLYREEQYVKNTHDAIAILLKALEDYNTSEDYIKSRGPYLKEYQTTFDSLVAEDTRCSKLYADMTQAVNNMEPLVTKLADDAIDVVKKQTNSVGKMADWRGRLALFMGLLGIGFAFFVAAFITRQITLPITRAVSFSKNMSRGDFSKTLDIDQKDEIGTLAKALNSIVTNLGRMVADIVRDMKVLSDSSENLKGIADKLSANAQDTSSKSESVASASEEMNASMSSIAAAMEQTAVNISSVAAATEENTATISEIATNTLQAKTISNQAVDQARVASTDMEKLGKAAEDIGTVTEAITKISEQTKLLALNATIEAARAGEAGRGFAVVAGEIKQLSEQTADATKKIRSQISGIQGTTINTVKGIASITTIITEINDIVSSIATTINEQSTATNEIGTNINQAALGVQEVNENVAQSSTVASAISKDMADVNVSAAEMKSSSALIKFSAVELSQLAENLKKMVDQFQL
jgi:methyl-accepting chemotaxis protein